MAASDIKAEFETRKAQAKEWFEAHKACVFAFFAGFILGGVIL